jgi:hypothetical protein
MINVNFSLTLSTDNFIIKFINEGNIINQNDSRVVLFDFFIYIKIILLIFLLFDKILISLINELIH